ncbi:hypothetical protein BGX30_004261, partial [Mortierella sp. GBA39]
MTATSTTSMASLEMMMMLICQKTRTMSYVQTVWVQGGQLDLEPSPYFPSATARVRSLSPRSCPTIRSWSCFNARLAKSCTRSARSSRLTTSRQASPKSISTTLTNKQLSGIRSSKTNSALPASRTWKPGSPPSIHSAA